MQKNRKIKEYFFSLKYRVIFLNGVIYYGIKKGSQDLVPKSQYFIVCQDFRGTQKPERSGCSKNHSWLLRSFCIRICTACSYNKTGFQINTKKIAEVWPTLYGQAYIMLSFSFEQGNYGALVSIQICYFLALVQSD